MQPTWQPLAEQAVRLWRGAEHVFALTGAGISVPSGIPDFRSPGGLWAKFNPDRVATAQALHSRPREVWEFLLACLPLLDRARPNAAHVALAELEKSGRLDGVVTQNIDNLHQEAGSTRVVEFHGSARRFYCQGCGKEYPVEQALRLTTRDIPWRCAACGQIVRPDIVFFGEAIPAQALDASRELAGKADLVLIVGTSGTVAPASMIPAGVKSRGGRVLEINLEDSACVALPDVRIQAPAEDVLPYLCARILAEP